MQNHSPSRSEASEMPIPWASLDSHSQENECLSQRGIAAGSSSGMPCRTYVSQFEDTSRLALSGCVPQVRGITYKGDERQNFVGFVAHEAVISAESVRRAPGHALIVLAILACEIGSATRHRTSATSARTRCTRRRVCTREGKVSPRSICERC